MLKPLQRPAAPALMRPATVERCIEQATLAPSSHNTQPWLFRVSEDHVELIADRTRALPVIDPFDRELTVSCGAALFNLRVAAAVAGYDALVELLPRADDPDLLARVTFASGTGRMLADAAELGAALPERRTYRRRFLPAPVEATHLRAFCAAAELEGAHVHVLGTETQRQQASALVSEADAILWQEPRWRRELASWMHPRRRADGLAVPGFGVPAAQLLIRSFDMGEGVAARDTAIAAGSPLLLVLGTDGDKPFDWLRAGQALEHMLLRACADGLQASFLNQPIQLAKLRQRLQSLAPDAGNPQVMLRLGYAPSRLPPTPRRPLAEVLQAVWPVP